MGSGFSANNPTISGGVMPGGLPGAVAYPSLMGFLFYPATAVSTIDVNATVLNLGKAPLVFDSTLDDPEHRGCSSYTTWTAPDPHGEPLSWATSSRPVQRVTRSCSEEKGDAV